MRRACEALLTSSQDLGTGGFSYRRAKRASGGLPSGVIPCLTGNMVWSLIRLGYLGDERIDQGIEWLTRYLRFDDSDSAPPSDWPYNRWDMCYGRHSCFMGVVKGLKALVSIPEEKRSKAVTRTINDGAEFLLKHHLFKQSHNLKKVAKPGFKKLGFPRMYQTDILEILTILKAAGRLDPRCDEATALLRSKRKPDGRWVLEDTMNGKLLVDVEAKGQPSKWITLHAMCALKPD